MKSVENSETGSHSETTGEARQSVWKIWAIRVGAILLAALWIALIAGTWAEADAQGADSPVGGGPAVNGDDEYSFKWLDPEKKIYVLQNRRYQKAGRPEISILGGTGFSNPYNTAWSVEPRFAFYFREDLGIELFYTSIFNSRNNVYQALIGTKSNAYPFIRELRSQYGATLQWVPWYAKINVFNKILYFDWYLSAGAGNIHSAVDKNVGGTPNFVEQDQFAAFLNTGHQYHLNDTVKIRIDFSGAFYQAPIIGLSGDQAWYSNYIFSVGLGFKL